MPKTHDWDDLYSQGGLVGRDLEIYWGGVDIDRGPIREVSREDDGTIRIYPEWAALFDQGSNSFAYDADLLVNNWSIRVNDNFPVAEMGNGLLVSASDGGQVIVIYPQGNNLRKEDVKGFPVAQESA